MGKPNAAERLAARFAAKEAGMKAIGTGLRHGVTWQDVEVLRLPGQRPVLKFNGKAAEFAASTWLQAHASLSFPHERPGDCSRDSRRRVAGLVPIQS